MSFNYINNLKIKESHGVKICANVRRNVNSCTIFSLSWIRIFAQGSVAANINRPSDGIM